jgi:hypothetical protein
MSRRQRLCPLLYASHQCLDKQVFPRTSPQPSEAAEGTLPVRARPLTYIEEVRRE